MHLDLGLISGWAISDRAPSVNQLAYVPGPIRKSEFFSGVCTQASISVKVLSVIIHLDLLFLCVLKLFSLGSKPLYRCLAIL